MDIAEIERRLAALEERVAALEPDTQERRYTEAELRAALVESFFLRSVPNRDTGEEPQA